VYELKERGLRKDHQFFEGKNCESAVRRPKCCDTE